MALIKTCGLFVDTTSNIQFLEEDQKPFSSSIFTTASFAGGNVLPGCELDALIATVKEYFL